MRLDTDIRETLTDRDRQRSEAWTNFRVCDSIVTAKRQLKASAKSTSLYGCHHRLVWGLDGMDHGYQWRAGYVRPKLLDVCPYYNKLNILIGINNRNILQWCVRNNYKELSKRRKLSSNVLYSKRLQPPYIHACTHTSCTWYASE